MKTIDAHAGGEPLRLIMDGFPAPRGNAGGQARVGESSRRSPAACADAGAARTSGHVRRDADRTGVAGLSRRRAVHEHRRTTAPCAATASSPLTTIALERGSCDPGGDGAPLRRYATRARFASSARWQRGRVERVRFVQCAVVRAAWRSCRQAGARRIRADVAFGGAFYAIVDGESVGLPLDARHVPELRRVGSGNRRAIEARRRSRIRSSRGSTGIVRHDLHRTAARLRQPTCAT